MKRRAFLSMMGGAAAAPALSAVPSIGLPAKLKTLGMAHAKKYPMVSVMGLTRRMKISPHQAQDVLNYLMKKGVIGKPGIAGTGITSAASHVFKPVPHQIAGVKTIKDMRLPEHTPTPKDPERRDATSMDWLMHLRVLAASNGFTLSPRALGAVA